MNAIYKIKNKKIYIMDNVGWKPPVPYHGAKEIPESLRKKIIKEMEL